MSMAKHRNWEPPLILLAALLWVPGAGGEAFLSDDLDHITTWGQPPFGEIWRWFYTEHFNYYRPLTALLWNLEHALWGFDLLGYQLVNFALHAGCALLVRALGRSLFPGDNRIGLLAALIFLFLPGLIFGVLMVSALTGLLCALLYLAAMVAYLRGRTHSVLARVLGPLFFLLALLTKELALSLPLLVGIWEAVALRGERKLTLTAWLKACWPYGLVLASYLLFRWSFFGQMPYSPLHANATSLRLLVNAATYAAKGVAPWGLENLKPFFRAHPLALALVSGGLLALATAAAWRGRRVLNAGHAFGLLWFGICVLPVLSLYSPWNTYLPAAGTALLLGALGTWRAGDATALKRIRQGAVVVFLALSLTYSLDHQRHWREARTLCRDLATALVSLDGSDPIYLANLPAEWNDAPLFVSQWALRTTLRMHGHDRQVVALANVIKRHRAEHIEVERIDARTFAMRLTAPDEFFRLEMMDILSGARQPAPGLTYGKGAFTVRVTGLNAQGQANALRVDTGSVEELARVRIWDGEKLRPLVAP